MAKDSDEKVNATMAISALLSNQVKEQVTRPLLFIVYIEKALIIIGSLYTLAVSSEHS